MIHVIATIRTATGRREDFLNEFHRLASLVRAEAGCIEYGPATDLDSGIAGQPTVRDDVVTVLEKWENVSALEAHLTASHMLSFRDTAADMVTGIEIRVLRPA